MIRTIEELALNAWPSLQTLLIDGWVVRFAKGYTRRANSVNPLYVSEQDADVKRRACERLYRERGLKVVFKMTSASQPEGLDALLAACGYEIDAPTSVQLMDLTAPDAAPAAGATPNPVANSHRPPSPVFALTLDATVTDPWFAAFCAMSGVDRRRHGTMRQLLGLIAPEKRCATLWLEDRVAACGLGVLQADHIGLFDIAVAPELRRRGCGQQLVAGLLAWGRSAGAHTAYLQVMLNNAPALRLYEKVGFREVYRYWYRVKA
jgi:ribosomal protein S18 acetylase RimI-like enzyme